MKYPIQTQIHDCHHDRPSTIIEDEIIQVFYSRVLLTKILSIDFLGTELPGTHNIERVGNPEGDIVQPCPLTTLRLDCTRE